MKKCKKAVVILIACASLAAGMCLTACAQRQGKGAETPETALGGTMEALKTLDLESFNKYTDNYIRTYTNWLGIPKGREYRVFNELLQPGVFRGRRYEENRKFDEAIVKNLSWDIEDVRINGNKAEIDLKVTNTDMSDVTGYYAIQIMEDMISSVDTGISGTVSDIFESAYDNGSLLQYMENADDIITVDVTVSASRKKGVWKIHVSDEFVNAFMGNLDSEDYSEEVEERLDELEAEYEKKMDEWGEDLEEEIESEVEEWADKFPLTSLP